eukprot:g19694.t1
MKAVHLVKEEGMRMEVMQDESHKARDSCFRGPTALSDMHAKWSEKGAHEFVPNMGSANYASRTDRNVRDNRMMAPVAFGQQPMVMQNAWMQGYMPEGQWNMQNQMMPGSSFGNGNLKPRTPRV